ncbi:MAG TPA: sporulation protein [Candidatus Elarobacter sp.]
MSLPGVRLAAVLVTAAAAFGLLAQPASAGLSLTVEPLVQELHVAPGASSAITVTVSNGGTDNEKVSIEPIDWTVTTDGNLQFRQTDLANPHSITRYLSVPSYSFVLAPGQKREFPLTMRLPASFPATAGVYWGGFLIRGASTGKAGVGPAGTVFVYETVGSPKAHLGLKAMRVTQSGTSGAVLSARMQNDGNAYARVSARLLIEQGGRVVQDRDLATPTIFPGATRVMNEEIKNLPPGDYRAELTIDYGTDVVLTGSTEFRIH